MMVCDNEKGCHLNALKNSSLLLKAITNLPKKEFWELATWFDDVKNRAWDEQMEADAAAGRLDFLFEEAEAERSKGKLKDWPPAQ